MMPGSDSLLSRREESPERDRLGARNGAFDDDRYELLTTKLAIPRPRSPLVPRERLLARLEEALAHKLTLLSAPAGFGKTTLVAEWIQQSGESAFQSAWVALDAGDNDPVRFWRYVISACQAFQANLGSAALSLLQARHQPPFEAVLTTLINELAQLPGPCALVLEDYHLITSPQIQETMTFLLDHLPTTLHLVMLTRTDPPLPLARMRARYELNELRRADLRFSPAETQAFLQQAVPSPLSAETIAQLNDRTEGWAAGLHLVALALQGRQEKGEIEQYLATFTGSYQPIREYLVADVLGAQPEPLREFLVQTAFLSRLTGSLCDVVTDRTDSAIVLEQLERANLFLVPLDASQQWYRFHALFAEAIQHEAQQRLGEARLREMSQKASLWYEGHGLLAEAVESSLAAQDFARAADLVELMIAPRLAQNEYHTLRRWMEQLPEEVLQARPTLCLIYAMAILFTSGRFAPEAIARVEPLLQIADQQWQAAGNRSKLGEVLALRAQVVWFQGNPLHSFASARQALDLLPEENAHWRGASLTFVGVEELLNGRMNVARQTFLRAIELCQLAGNIYATLNATLLLGRVCIEQGQLRQAAELYQQVLAATDQMQLDRDLAQIHRGRALIGLSVLDLEWNALEAAELHALQAFEIGQSHADEELQVQSSLVLARTQHARGEHAQAQRWLLWPLTQTKRPLVLREVEAWQARLALQGGDLAAIQRWYATRTESDAVPRIQQEQEALVVARMHLAQGEAQSALRLLQDWQTKAHADGRVRSDLESSALIALAHAALDDLPQARQTLVRALSLAHTQGYQRLFLDEGEPMAALLRFVLRDVREEPLAAYVRTLLLAFAQERTGLEAPSQPSPGLLMEPLSSQEQRVLRLLAAGLSNPEIAQELVVSINTVKTHVKHIFHKLDVASREEASDVARNLRLL